MYNILKEGKQENVLHFQLHLYILLFKLQECGRLGSVLMCVYAK